MIIPVVIIAFLLFLSYHDIKSQEIPANATYFITACAALFVIILWIIEHDPTQKQVLFYHILTGISFGVVASIFVFLSHEKGLGSGDIYALILVGIGSTPVTGIIAIVYASWIGSLYGIIQWVFTKKIRGQRVPLIPLLTIGYVLSLLTAAPFLHLLGFIDY